MFRKMILGVLVSMILSGCQTLSSSHSQNRTSLTVRSNNPIIVESTDKEEDVVWIPEKINKIWVNSYVDDDGNMIEGHYKHVVSEPGHWALQESIPIRRTEQKQIESKSNQKRNKNISLPIKKEEGEKIFEREKFKRKQRVDKKQKQFDQLALPTDQYKIIKLKSGDIVRGKIIARQTDHIIVDQGVGYKVQYYFDEIESITVIDNISPNQKVRDLQTMDHDHWKPEQVIVQFRWGGSFKGVIVEKYDSPLALEIYNSEIGRWETYGVDRISYIADIKDLSQKKYLPYSGSKVELDFPFINPVIRSLQLKSGKNFKVVILDHIGKKILLYIPKIQAFKEYLFDEIENIGDV